MLPLRLTYVLAKRGPTIALVLAVLALTAFGAAGWAATHPPTTEVTDPTNSQGVELATDANATVTENSSLYDRGEVLQNPPVFPRSAPELRLSPETRSTNATFERVSQNVTLVYMASRNGEAFWTHHVPLASASANGTGAVSTTATVDTERVRDRLAVYRNDLGDAGTVSAAVRIESSYRVAGYADSVSTTAPLSFGSDWYDIGDGTASQSHDTPRSNTVVTPSTRPVQPDALAGLGALLALAVGGIVFWYRAWRPSLDAVTAELHRHRYDEWISTGQVSLEAGGNVVEVRTLEDLVDVAIDTEGRVVYDPSIGCYLVLTGSARYQYVPVERQVE